MGTPKHCNAWASCEVDWHMMEEPRPRPHVWRRRLLWMIPLGIVLLIVGAWGLFRYRAQQGVERALARVRAQGHPVTLGELDRWYPQPQGPNAATVYIGAFAAYVKDEELEQQIPTFSRTINYWPAFDEPLADETLAAMEAYLDKNAEALAILHETNISESRYPIDLRAGMFTLLPHLGDLRRGARLLEMEAMLAAERGDAGQAAAAIHSILRLAESLRHEPIIISALVRISIIALAIQALEQSLHRARFDAGQLEALQAGLEAADDPQVMVRGLAGERASTLSLFRQFGKGAGSLAPSAPAGFAGRVFEAVGWLDVDKSYFLQLMELDIESTRAGDWAAIESRPPIPRRYLMSNLLRPALGAAVKTDLQLRARLRTAVAAMAAERYRLDHGRLPDDLQDLVPRYLDEVPLDPFTGEELRYTRTAAAVIYSVGHDGVDDGGRDGDQPGERYTPGTDITFTLPLTPPDDGG